MCLKSPFQGRDSGIFRLPGGLELTDDLRYRGAVQLQFSGNGAEAHLAPAKGDNVLFLYYLDYLSLVSLRPAKVLDQPPQVVHF